jgi:hypothetical protein
MNLQTVDTITHLTVVPISLQNLLADFSPSPVIRQGFTTSPHVGLFATQRARDTFSSARLATVLLVRASFGGKNAAANSAAGSYPVIWPPGRKVAFVRTILRYIGTRCRLIKRFVAYSTLYCFAVSRATRFKSSLPLVPDNMPSFSASVRAKNAVAIKEYCATVLAVTWLFRRSHHHIVPQEESYMEIARARISAASPEQPSTPKPPKPAREKPSEDQLNLFGENTA